MNTGTLTFHSAYNNGSFLQAYALQTVLLQKGFNNLIINFQSKSQRRQYSLVRFPRAISDIARNLVAICHFRKLKNRKEKFESLRERYLKLTKICTTEEEALTCALEFDMIICGSDQIWNTRARDYSDIFFLPGRKNKIAYAVSCGPDLNQVDQAKVLKYVPEFKYVSVREQSTANFLEQFGINNISLVLDPTLLLDKEIYQQLYSNEGILQGKYVFLYTINYEPEILEAAKKFSEKVGMPIYTSFTGYSVYKCRKYGIQVLYDAGPDMFLNLIEHAYYVCTNSFHGIAFSIIYQKNFFRLGSKGQNGLMKKDDRIDSILSELGLSSNYILGDTISSEEIDWDKVYERLNKERDHSLHFLENALCNI